MTRISQTGLTYFKLQYINLMSLILTDTMQNANFVSEVSLLKQLISHYNFYKRLKSKLAKYLLREISNSETIDTLLQNICIEFL